jgi:general secretion pathway protein D
MNIFQTIIKLKRISSVFTLVVFLTQLTSCAFAPWEQPKVKNFPPEARVAETKKQLASEPDKTKIRQEYYLNKESAIGELLTQAEQARIADDLESASKFFDRVLSIAPDNQSAITGKQEIDSEKKSTQKLQNASDAIKMNNMQLAKSLVHDVLLERPQNNNALSLEQEIKDKSVHVNNQPPELKPPFEKPITLELRDANIKVVFDALSKATGINFILDKDIRPDTKATIYVKKMPVEDAIDMVLSSNGLEKKALSENTALIYPSNPLKLKSYQDLMIRNFYLNNTTAKQVSAMLKAMLKIKDMYVDDRLNMIVIRDTPEVVRIAEKLIKANDIADAEVMLNIEVLEVSRSRLQELGITYPTQLSVLSTGTTGLTLEALKSVTSKTIGVSPNPAVNFKKTTGDVNLLSNPRIRVKNNEKAKILVGDKVPIITTTSTANVGISESVTYVDVGLKLDVQPRITLDDYVNIKVGLEVSSLGDKTVTTNGATVYTIGTRNADTVLRLKDGETQILAGLILDDERKNANKVPGLGDIPLIGRLFSNQEDKKSKTEIVLVITPRIIGNIQLPSAEVSEYWSGTENVISDKPLIGIPSSGNIRALSPRDRLIEQRERRASEINQTPSTSTDLQEEPESNPTTPDGTRTPTSTVDDNVNQSNDTGNPEETLSTPPPNQSSTTNKTFSTTNPPPHM